MSTKEHTLDRATHFSIVWAVVLAVLTIVEWNSLDRDPMSEQIFLPFIERNIELKRADASTVKEPGRAAVGSPGESVRRDLQTEVEINFNGPLFLACFFGPVLLFHAVALLLRQLSRGS